MAVEPQASDRLPIVVVEQHTEVCLRVACGDTVDGDLAAHDGADDLKTLDLLVCGHALFAVGASGRWSEHGITANAVMPGAIATGLQRHLSDTDWADRGWQNPTDGVPPPGWTTPEYGAATSTWAAVAPELATTSGVYLEDCAVARPWTGPGPLPRGHYLPYALDPARADRLWQLSVRLTAGGRGGPRGSRAVV